MISRKRFIPIQTILLVIFILFGLSTCNQKQQEQNSKKEKTHVNQALPRLTVIDGDTRDLGKVKEGIKTTVTFTLVNTGEADATNISVHDLSKGGCTAVSHVSQLARGDSAQLKFTFETLGYGGKEETRKIRVRYNNPGHSPITLSVHAKVLPTEPHEVPIGELYYNFFVLVDVRDEQAFRNGHIAGAINIPPDEMLQWASRLPRDFMIYLYSDHGEKSDELAIKLRNEGFKEALSMVGGINEWKRRYGDRVIIQGPK